MHGVDGALDQLVGLDHLVEQTDPQRLRRWDPRGPEDHAHRVVADQAPEQQAGRVGDGEAAGVLGLEVLGHRSADPGIAAQGDLGGAADGDAVDRRDHGDPCLQDRAGDVVEALEGLMDLGLRGRRMLQVLSGGEGTATPGEDDATDGLAGSVLTHQRCQAQPHVDGEGVELLGAVEGEHRDVAYDGDVDVIGTVCVDGHGQLLGRAKS